MPPIPEPRVPAEFDSDDEESLLILSSMGKKCYSDLFSENDQTETTSTASLDSEDANAKSIDSELAAAEGGGGSCVMRVWGAYYGALGRWPLLIKSITALILMALADFFAQMVEHLHRISYDSWVDILRMLRFGVFGLVGAPWTHYYYAWLDRTLPPTPQPWTMTTAGEKKPCRNFVPFCSRECDKTALLCVFLCMSPFVSFVGRTNQQSK
jgi:hypothetical protein